MDGTRESARVSAVLRAFERHPYAILVLTADGRLIAHNESARVLLGSAAPVGWDQPGSQAAADVLGLPGATAGGIPLLRRALEGDTALPEVRTDLPPGCAADAAWLTIAPLGGGGDGEAGVLVELRPGRRDDRRRRTEPHWGAGPQLRIRALGRTQVDSAEASLGGRWLDQRTGRLLKLLVTERHRVLFPDEIAEQLWADSGPRNLQGVRYFVHALRERLEPERAPRAESAFVRFLDGAYSLDRRHVRIDADDFERDVKGGRAAVARADHATARVRLGRAVALYRGDFLADEPYADWARSERDRLRALAAEALRLLAGYEREAGDLDAAAGHLERLADLEPFDTDVHRQLIGLCLERRRHSEALRRYTTLRQRLLATFGEDVDFTLVELAAGGDADVGRLA
jgi:two-component SAPR family response regulator